MPTGAAGSRIGPIENPANITTQPPPASRLGFLSGGWSCVVVISAGLRVLALAGVFLLAADAAAEETEATLAGSFATTIRPFLESYCTGCHGAEKPKGQLDLTVFQTMDAVVKDHPRWALVLEQLASGEMPPEEAKQHPTQAQRDEVTAWIKAMRGHEAAKNAGDPGPVPARRLSNAEYDYSIRDLTGQDLRPTTEFPVDPANQAGFDNSGESLTMSPALLKKYLQAARSVADHLVLTPDGIDFAPHPMLAETDRDKYCILRIVDFYNRQPTDLAGYFLAAWRHRQRAALGRPGATLAEVAAEAKVSRAYLERVWTTLTGAEEMVGPLAKLQALWRALPAPEAARPDAAAREGCVAMRNFVTGLRKKLACQFGNLSLTGVSSSSQCFVLWKDRQYATHRRTLNPDALEPGGIPHPAPPPKTKNRNKDAAAAPPPPEPVAHPDLFIPAAREERAPWLDSFQRFCDVFPDAFFIAERGRMFIEDDGDKGRLLSAGFHNQLGYFRDDQPLMELILDEAGRRELDRLWLEFDFIARVPERMHVEFIFYERAESKTMNGPQFDFARSEDRDATTEAKIQRLAEVYLATAHEGNPGAGAEKFEIIADHFKRTSASIRLVEKARAYAEPAHLSALLAFAEKAWRRPLEPAEREDLPAFYHSLRDRDGLGHEEAIRDCVVSVLMSPGFCYRCDPADAAAPDAPEKPGNATPLTGYALASRLSYFLWSSLPDAALLGHAASGDLVQPEVLAAQARRMLKDPRIRALAVEFGGNWLDFRRFEEHNAVDRTRFPAFNDELRQAMFEEPVRFLTDLVQEDRPLTDLIHGRHTFVNAVLAKHYGMDDVTVPPGGWVRVDHADRHERGGLLPMAVFQAKNAPGLRTSPVKRGYWVVRRLLGEQIPPPPATVPELPRDEAAPGTLTVRELLAAHRADKTCASCHARFDSFGLVFENYGPVGERRTADLGGRPVDTRATFPGGIEKAGLQGLRDFIRENRQDAFLDNAARKLFSYALGRSLLLSDEAALAEMHARLAENGQFPGSLIEAIVLSPQFRNKRTPSLQNP